jgi:hypothetical protein
MASTPHPLSAAQRTFVEGAEALGATAPADARPLPELPRLSRRELDELLELGLVREATDWRYYVFRSRGAVAAPLPPPESSPSSTPPTWTRGRYVRTFLFWLILILIPILLFQLTDPR